jgi:hypothetical protein
MKESMAKRFCQCIKKVRRTLKRAPLARGISSQRAELFGRTIKGNYKKQQKESRAIAICVKSVIQTRGKTLKKFSCGKSPKLTTQKPKY